MAYFKVWASLINFENSRGSSKKSLTSAFVFRIRQILEGDDSRARAFAPLTRFLDRTLSNMDGLSADATIRRTTRLSGRVAFASTERSIFLSIFFLWLEREFQIIDINRKVYSFIFVTFVIFVINKTLCLWCT